MTDTSSQVYGSNLRDDNFSFGFIKLLLGGSINPPSAAVKPKHQPLKAIYQIIFSSQCNAAPQFKKATV